MVAGFFFSACRQGKKSDFLRIYILPIEKWSFHPSGSFLIPPYNFLRFLSFFHSMRICPWVILVHVVGNLQLCVPGPLSLLGTLQCWGHNHCFLSWLWHWLCCSSPPALRSTTSVPPFIGLTGNPQQFSFPAAMPLPQQAVSKGNSCRERSFRNFQIPSPSCY